MLRFLSFLPLLLICSVLSAQVDTAVLMKKAEGKIGISDAQLIDFLMVTMERQNMTGGSSLKNQSLKTYMMPPRQTDETANPKCYALTAVAEFYANYDENYKVNLSPDYINLSISENTLKDAMTFLVKNGTVSADIMPYGSRYIPSTVRATQKYVLQNFLYLFRAENKSRQKLFALRTALVRGNPVIVEMKVPTSFADLAGVRKYEREKNTETAILPFVVVGYDEVEETIEILGTYGTSWGTNGYLTMAYDDFTDMAEAGYVLVPNL